MAAAATTTTTPATKSHFQELLGTASRSYVSTNKGAKLELSELNKNNDTVVALYFSAHWCPPCQRFTPQLVKVYNALRAAGKKLEIVYVPGDRSLAQYNEYFGKMPWHGIPFEDRETIQKLNELYECEGIPMLVILDKNGRLGNPEGVEAVSEKGAEGFPWLPAHVRSLDDATGSLNTQPCLVAFVDKNADSSAVIAELVQLDTSGTAEDLVLFYADATSRLASKVAGFLGVTIPSLVIVDLKNKLKYVQLGDIKPEAITTFVDKYHKKELKRTIKSAKPPANPTTNGLTAVVADTFESVVLDPKTTVLFDVYADWCGPCKIIKPHLHRVAKVLVEEMKVPNFAVGQMNSDENDTDPKYLPEPTIPNIKIFPARADGKDKVPIKFAPSKTVTFDGDGLLTFLHDNLKDTASKFDLAEAKAKLAAAKI